MRALFKDESGSVIAIAAAAIVTMTVVAAMAIDMSRYLIIKSKFRQAMDTALIAGASVARNQDVQEVVENFFHANFPDNYMGADLTSEITIVTNANDLSWTAEVNASMNTVFAQLFGINTIGLSQNATVAWDISKRVDAIFTLDTSASMCTRTERIPRKDDVNIIEYRPDHYCDKLNAMKEAISYIVEYGVQPIEGMGGPVFNVGIVPFNHKVKLPNPERVPTNLTNMEISSEDGTPDYYRDFTDAEPLAPIIPLTALDSPSDQQFILDKINRIEQTPEGQGWTRSNVAVHTAAMMLDPGYHTFFGGTEPGELNPMTTDKIVVMMTDGANVSCCFAVWPEGNYDNQYLYLNEVDNAHLAGLSAYPNLEQHAEYYGLSEKGLCERLKENGIVIYSVVFDVDDRDPGGQEIKDVYRDCASNEQFFFDVQNTEQLITSYQIIADSFNKLRITY